jgi:hypothetical protein
VGSLDFFVLNYLQQVLFSASVYLFVCNSFVIGLVGLLFCWARRCTSMIPYLFLQHSDFTCTLVVMMVMDGM